MFQRNIKPNLKKALSRSPVVLLNGARQVGKSTLVLELLKEDSFTYITFDDEIVYLSAKNDPTSFISNIEKPVIIDEIQRVPELFLAIKRDVDKNRHAGRYLLTGSANPLLIPRLGDSLAGRMEVIDLMPLSQGEILGIKEDFIDRVFTSQSIKSPKHPHSKEKLIKKIMIGGYPAVQNVDIETQEAWMRSYLNLILQRDIKDLAQIEKITELPNILKLLAYRSGNLLNVAEIARESKMVNQTLHRYVALLQTIFLIHLQQSWSGNLTTRLIKSPKVYLVDSGLLAYLLGVNVGGILQDPNSLGKITETFVVNELRKQATWSSTYPESYHFRTPGGEEVDIILENRAGNIVGIEVKSSESVDPRDFKGMRYLKEKAGKKFLQGIVLYAGHQVVPFGDDLFAVPIECLWN